MTTRLVRIQVLLLAAGALAACASEATDPMQDLPVQDSADVAPDTISPFRLEPTEASGPVGSCFTFTLVGDLPSSAEGPFEWGMKCGDGEWGSFGLSPSGYMLQMMAPTVGPSRELCFDEVGECWLGALGVEAHVVIYASGDVTPGGSTIEAPAIGGGTIKVVVPDGAATGEITLTARPLVDLVGTSVSGDLVADPEPDEVDVAVDLGPDGTLFNQPVAIELPLSASGTPNTTRRVYLVDETTGALSLARLRDGTVIVGVVSPDGASVGFRTDHFSTYAVGSLNTIFCPAGWATSFPLAVPCSFYSESAFAAAGTDVMLFESERKKMYVQVLKELFLRSKRPRGSAEMGLFETFFKSLDGVIEDEPVPYKKILKGAKYLQLMANDALASSVPALVEYAPGLQALSDGTKFIQDETKWFSSVMKVADCVVEGLLKVLALHAVDYDRALERLAATREYVVQSNLYKKDPAFRAALDQVQDDIELLQSSVAAQIVDALPRVGDSDCGMSVLKSLIKFAMSPLLVALKGTGTGLVATVIFEFAVVDVVMDDMVAATQKGLALSALGTFFVHGGLYDATKDLAGTTVTSASWGDAALRKKLLAFQVSNYAQLAIHQSAAEIMRMEGAGWLNKNLTGAVAWTAELFGAVSREDIATAHDATQALLEANDKEIRDSYPSLCGGAGTQPAVCGSTVPCVPVCGLAVCGDDGCGGSCGTCGEGMACNDGACEPSTCVPVCGVRVCGPDPVCSQSCGTCGANENCTAAGACVPKVPVCPGAKDCTGRVCGPDPVCVESCGTCTGTDTCNASGACVPAGCGTNCGEMVTVPAGPFMQGCNEAVDDNCISREYPYHEVDVPAFEIDKYEVTMGLYGRCVDSGVCTVPSSWYSPNCNWGKTGKEDHPMNCISWSQAREYCAWAGKRFCSESEWEKASRGTDGRKYPWGNETATCDYAVMDDGVNGCGEDWTWPVGSKAAGESPYGAMDMTGNVGEWVEDDWHSDYTGAPTNGSAWIDNPRGSDRVERGGSFGSTGRFLRSSVRNHEYDPYDGVDSYGGGIRCCRSK